MRFLLFILAVASVTANCALLGMYQRDEQKLRETTQMRVKIYDSARQIIADLKSNDPDTFTNVVVPIEVGK